MGATKRERAIMAGNQQGKTEAGGFEAAFHLTGDYPDWWEGRRWERPVHCWVACDSNELTRDNPQKKLMGVDGSWGSGAIPESSIAKRPTMSRGFPGLIDHVLIKHKSGGNSSLQFKAYEQGVTRWAGATLDFIWCDEEPPAEIYSEAQARITATGGMIYLTLTPLKGMSTVVNYFHPRPTTKYRGLVKMGIKDAGHIAPEEREMIIQSYPEHEREARVEGEPMLGSGRVFQFAKSVLSCEPFEIPGYWAVIGGIDFGYGDHPFAAAKIAWDRDNDILYLTNTYKEKEIVPSLHVSSLRPWGKGFPYMWPHDGGRSFGDQGPIAEVYRKEGLQMWRTHSTFKEGGFSPEAAVMELIQRMQTGRFKAFRHLEAFWEEFATYHRKKGQLVQQRDDIISALMKAVMMLRKARVPDNFGQFDTHVVSSFDPFAQRHGF